MSIPKFDNAELEAVFETPPFGASPGMKFYKTPVTAHDGIAALFQKKPLWQVIEHAEFRMFTPRVVPDNVARAFCFEARPFDANKEGGGSDMFGIIWEYVAQVGGSMVRPGKPFLEDISEWKEKVVFPDIDKWDWEGAAKANNGTYLQPDNFNVVWFQTGFYERLISLLDFEGAVLAVFDEDSQADVHEFFDKLTDLYIRIFDKYLTYFDHIHAVYFHDDWGSQKETFFSPSVAEEMIVPYMKRITEFLHSKGIFAELHSCGQLYKQVPNMIKAGWDAWGPQTMNDSYKIYDDYGDKIIIAVTPQGLPENFAKLPEEEQRKYAREFADRFARPDKPSMFNFYGAQYLTPAFREELYIRSRENYSK
ncbi:MAG: methyltransferase [Oscillospiraceae bacterium]|jgi:hypothetical protein|nr:methyltransferase [Oscillospiraceae bacterium]